MKMDQKSSTWKEAIFLAYIEENMTILGKCLGNKGSAIVMYQKFTKNVPKSKTFHEKKIN